MKILYAIQGTGNGHLARAYDVYPALCQYGDVTVLVSGIQGDIALPFPVQYSFYGLSFIFGKRGGIDYWKTFRKMKLGRLLHDIFKLRVQDYDLVISDFEPISAWACKIYKKPCIALSHQCTFLHDEVPKPKVKDTFGNYILRNLVPATAHYGFHFKRFGDNVLTPVIRKQIRNLKPEDHNYYTVYLPSYDDNALVKELSFFPAVQWKVFSKHCKEAFVFKNISVTPVENNAFINSMENCTGVLCGAGFETPAEALFLNKKLMVIPMAGQYEQQCNAACLETMSIPVIDVLGKKNRKVIAEWLDTDKKVSVHYPDHINAVVAKLVEDYWAAQSVSLKLA